MNQSSVWFSTLIIESWGSFFTLNYCHYPSFRNTYFFPLNNYSQQSQKHTSTYEVWKVTNSMLAFSLLSAKIRKKYKFLTNVRSIVLSPRPCLYSPFIPFFDIRKFFLANHWPTQYSHAKQTLHNCSFPTKNSDHPLQSLLT